MVSRRFIWRTLVSVSALVAVSVAVSACGSSSSSGGGKSAFTGPTVTIKDPITAAGSGCGSLPLPAVKDPDGVVASFPQATQEQFKGYTGTVHKSKWANWKPSHAPPYKVGIVWSPLISDFQIKNLKALQAELAKDPDIKVVTKPPGTEFNVTNQIAQNDAIINEKPDLIVVQANAPDALIPAAKRAGALDIPTIEMQGTIADPNVVNVQSNNYQSAGVNAAGAMQITKGTGNVVLTHGITGLFTDLESFKGFHAALDKCPKAKVIGETTGLFQNATIKGETQKFISTHPQKVDVALQIGAMSTGIMQAFDQSGRPMPIVNTIGATRGSLGYWINNQDHYQSIGTALGPSWLGEAVGNVARRMLDGQGIKTTDVINSLDLITNQNLDQYAKTEWSLRTPGEADDIPRGDFLTNPSLNPFFNNPKDEN